ncbi:hypothetical protein TanjilG_15162 [Lupinus angustifolius]|uniref:B box-type domain-containing protein n=2 Tax=Lupinus angustifolius TaxID=3871 RepID=A0A1J7I0D1_LUPAN|nr:hypothetical protein TanjilG_15162 [Lupinus angustifolius]
MKIQCNACEAAEAKVLCCADEAALCWECDEKVHAANKLASKHQRVPLSTSASQVPKCDICQDTVGYFFCLEDRALLCRNCDLVIHTVNAHVSAHQRFLLTGVRVGLEATKPGASSSLAKSHSEEKMSNTKSSSISGNVSPMPQSFNHNEVLPIQVGRVGEFPQPKVSYSGDSTVGNVSHWPIDEFLWLSEFGQNYNCMGGSSKDDSGKRWDSDSSLVRLNEVEMDNDDFSGHVPDSCWTVPQIPSPPTASGLYWPKDSQYTSDAMFVPDICFSDMQQPDSTRNNFISPKRRQL